ncbi:unnamed protein product, partial [marine sediment metagenome]
YFSRWVLPGGKADIKAKILDEARNRDGPPDEQGNPQVVSPPVILGWEEKKLEALEED